jgi:pyruvate kinase
MTSNIASLLAEIENLIAVVGREGEAQSSAWLSAIDRSDFAESALNLAHYLALRHRDLRHLQRPLTALGLSCSAALKAASCRRLLR